MIECTVRYYFKSQQRRVVCFERSVRFAAVPFIGSALSLKDDFLEVELVQFREESSPVLIVRDSIVENDAELNEIIDDMKGRRWTVASDIVRKMS